ncbi:thioredoxin [Imleria badia]|nr:thioredoxin [Imleria badia]
MSVKEIKSLGEFQNLINSGKVIFIDFWATWCGPCKTISPVFEKLAKENAIEGAEFYKVDVDDQPEIAQEVGIRAMPTFIAFKDGNKVGDLVGAAPQRLEALVRTGLSVV